jgi:hypothetical protein
LAEGLHTAQVDRGEGEVRRLADGISHHRGETDWLRGYTRRQVDRETGAGIHPRPPKGLHKQTGTASTKLSVQRSFSLSFSFCVKAASEGYGKLRQRPSEKSIVPPVLEGATIWKFVEYVWNLPK